MGEEPRRIYIDSHAHLDAKAFDRDREEVVQRAWDAGLLAIITVCVEKSLEGIERALSISEENEAVFATVGVHPHDAVRAGPEWIARIKELAANPNVVGIGETGLDYHYMHSPRDVQLESFQAFTRLACQLDLPLVVHTRLADADTVAVLNQAVKEGGGPLRGVVHCFSGDYALAKQILDTGLHLSFTGILSFPHAGPLRDVVKKIPLERVLIETDSPYLAPVPLRGRRNEPSYVVHVAEALATLVCKSREEVARMTSRNAARLFRLRAVSRRLDEGS